MTDPLVLLQILWTGAATSSIFVLLTIAFSLTQKVTGLWNFAQAGFMGIAFYATYFVLNELQLPLIVALAAGAVVGAAASTGAAKNAVVARPARGFTRMMKFAGLIVSVCLVSS